MAATKTQPMTRKAGAPAKPTPARKSSQNSAAGTAVNKTKTPAKPNASILSFFKKTDEDHLFVTGVYSGKTRVREREKEVGDVDAENGNAAQGAVGNVVSGDEKDIASRFNEDAGPVKRRKMDSPTTKTERDSLVDGTSSATSQSQPASKKSAGPFVEDSDSESDSDDPSIGPSKASPIHSLSIPTPATEITVPSLPAPASSTPEATVKMEPPEVDIQQPVCVPPKPPLLVHQATSASLATLNDDQFANFEGVEGEFDDDVFDEGEEFVERQYMEEQQRSEMDEDEDGSFEDSDIAIKQEPVEQAEAASCPICSVSLSGVSEQDGSTHVNNCLDGNPTPLPENKPTTAISDGAARFKRPPRPPKPGQENPFAVGESSAAAGGGSAFSKLMSGHAEDAAWAAASAAENAARGKPAYQRTCPFYKILPGFSICVDAFRYGAVKGCNAYFLSHFHSDHYIGLTSTWTHGPIYCSKVTANLVRQQLRVDPLYVVPLDWETPCEIPGTNGVVVTMISANHCPGSSLFLYEKKLSGHTAAKPKQTRVLHCGDFRACPAHIKHPQLMPDIVDKMTGKSRQQKIDVCYLDTTYLNPKYAFPCQEEVIKACAEMCVSLNKLAPDASDGWEQMKRARAGEGMVKFIRKDSAPSTIKEEEEDGSPDSKQSMKLMTNVKLGNEKTRIRLLVIVGTYSIGKERICVGIAKALGSKIYAPTGKTRIVRALEDPELMALMTSNPREAQVHMTPLFEIRGDTLDEYLAEYSDSFGRVVGFRPSGWQYRPPNSRFVEAPAVQTVLHSKNWKSEYSMKELVPQRGSTSRASSFGVPYSEHSSFRELTMFCCALRIEKIIPTVNVGSAKGRERMKGWIERWMADRKKNGLFKLGEGTEW